MAVKKAKSKNKKPLKTLNFDVVGKIVNEWKPFLHPFLEKYVELMRKYSDNPLELNEAFCFNLVCVVHYLCRENTVQQLIECLYMAAKNPQFSEKKVHSTAPQKPVLKSPAPSYVG